MKSHRFDPERTACDMPVTADEYGGDCGYFLVPSANSAEPHSLHSMGGPASRAGALSPNTGKPLLLLLSVDFSDPRLSAWDMGGQTLVFYYSWTCGIHQGLFVYRLVNGTVEVLSFARGSAEPDFPYADYPAFFPREPRGLRPIAAADQRLLDRLNRRDEGSCDLAFDRPDLAVPRAQVGGIPRAMQWPLPALTCPVCQGHMPVIASVGDELTGGLRMTGNPYVQVIFHACTACVVIAAYNVCD